MGTQRNGKKFGHSGKPSKKGSRMICRFYCMQIAKRTNSKNRTEIAEFPARLDQHNRVLREIEGIKAKFSFHAVFQEHRLLPLKKSSKSPTIPVCLSESCLTNNVTRAPRHCKENSPIRFSQINNPFQKRHHVKQSENNNAPGPNSPKIGH